MAIEVDDLHVELDGDAGLVRAIEALHLSLRQGETFALVGESGCGKSMTALALMRLLPENGHVTRGSVTLGGAELLSLPESRMPVSAAPAAEATPPAMQTWGAPAPRSDEQLRAEYGF